MTTSYRQQGDVMQHTAAGTAVVSGQVVAIGALLGVALVDIGVGATGSVAVAGVFAAPKTAAGSGQALTRGAPVMWDASEGEFAVPVGSEAQGAGDITGPGAVVWADAATTDTTVLIKFTGVPGTVKPAT